MKDQHEETLNYFNGHAKEWRNKAETFAHNKVNVIRQRNGFVIKVIENRRFTDRALDVGCGTGELVCDIARMDIDSVGVDFSEKMIELAIEKKRTEGIGKAAFKCMSIFDYSIPDKFDVISANGFIEYISLDKLKEFFTFVENALTDEGSFIVGSRNRIFNIFSVNAFTLNEIKGPDCLALLNEAVALSSGIGIEELVRLPCAAFQKTDAEHLKTGIDVTTRFQYSPVQLIQMLNTAGFKTIECYPVNVHGVPPAFKDKYPEVHASIAQLLQEFAGNNWELLPFASSFMLHVKKG